MLLQDFFRYLFMSIVAGIVMLFIRGWIAQEDWFIRRFGSDEQKKILHQKEQKVKDDEANRVNKPNENNNLGDVVKVSSIQPKEFREFYPKNGIKNRENYDNDENTFSKEELKKFVFSYFYTAMRNKTTPYLRLYSFPVERYFDDEYLSMEELREKREEYIRRWFNRIYEVRKIEIISQSKDKVTLKVIYDWDIRASRDRIKQGRSTVFMKLIYKNRRFYIKSIEILD